MPIEYPVGYGTVEPIAQYRPWELDVEYLKLYRTIQPYTLIDEMRCYELYTISQQLATVNGDVLEVGVWRGGSAALLGTVLTKQQNSTNASTHLWLADTFRGIVKAGQHDPYFKGGEFADTTQEIVEGILHTTGVTNYTVLAGVFPDDFRNTITTPIKLCHIDVDVYQSAQDVLEWVWPRLVQHGIVVFDDYGFYGCEGVTQLVEEYRTATDRICIHNLNGHAIFVKIA